MLRNLPLAHPRPNAEEATDTLMGGVQISRVPLVEHSVAPEVTELGLRGLPGRRWITETGDRESKKAHPWDIAPPRARAYAEYEDLLADPMVQIVAINTPPFLHGLMARRAAEAGKHIFVEKPLATTMEAAVAAVRAARSAGVWLGIDYVLRHHPLHRLATRVIHGGALGGLLHWSLENFAADDQLLPEHWFWDPARSGGIHVEHGVHFFDLCNHLVGAAPDQVSGYSQQRPDGRVDRVGATVRYDNRVLATFYHSFNQIGFFEQTTIRLNCLRGHITIEGWIPTELRLSGLVNETGLATLTELLGGRLTICRSFRGGRATVHHGGTTDYVVALVEATASAPNRQEQYKQAVQAGMGDLVAAIHENRPPEVSGEDGLLSLAVALAANEARGGRPHVPLIPRVERGG